MFSSLELLSRVLLLLHHHQSAAASMKAKRMPGLLCRSEASTAVCVPTTTRGVVLPRRPCRTAVHLAHPRRYSRLHDDPNPSANPAASLLLPPRGEKRLLHGSPKASALALPAKREKTQPAVAVKQPPPATPTAGDAFQVVVMRVSIHCQGCAGKVKKHISKMEGVTSFTIDLETKRVTVMGHISPLGVLESISKVKKAEFWYGSS